MDRSKRHIKDSAIYAVLITGICIAVKLGYDLTGFRKFGPPASPKSLPEVVAEWPAFLAIGTFVFLASWWWQASKKEMTYVICCSCQEIYEKGEALLQTCSKCKGQLEDLEGFYERHPELTPVNDRPIKQPQFNTCHECGKTFYSEDCPDSRCPDCQLNIIHNKGDAPDQKTVR